MSNKVFTILSRNARINSALAIMDPKMIAEFKSALESGQNQFEFWAAMEFVTFKGHTSEIPIRYFEYEAEAMAFAMLHAPKAYFPVKYGKVRVTIPSE
jgi:hypothetical protein